MNLVDSYVLEVIDVMKYITSEYKTYYIYTVEAVNMGGKFIGEIWRDEPTDIEKGYKFLS